MTNPIPILILLFLCFLLLYSPASCSPPLVHSPAGPIQGFQQNGANVFLSIPYAAPPVNALRWQPPMQIQPFTTPFAALSAGPGCIQDCTLQSGSCPPQTSEDCLSLSVYTPINANSQSNLSVLIYMHGGNFIEGTGTCPHYDGSRWVAAENFILVAGNYRLGALGFFFNQHAPANLGLMDQQRIMEWTKTNIASFGGDANRISIFGQSAGATSVCSHLQNPLSRSIISGAIVESVPAGIVLRQPLEVQKLNLKFSQLLNCDVNDMNCLQSAPVAAILQAQQQAAKDFFVNDKHFFEMAQAWEPVAGNVSASLPQPAGPSFVIPYPEIELFLSLPSDLPVMFGSTSGEGWLFSYLLFHRPMGQLELDIVLSVVYGLQHIQSLQSLYPLLPSDQKDYRGPLSRLLTDYLFTCPVRYFTRSIATNRTSSDAPVYSYYFDELSPESKQYWGPRYTQCWTEICHGAELTYVFNSAQAVNITLQPVEVQLAQTIGHYWANFAKYGNPNGLDQLGSDTPEWSPVLPDSYSVMHLIASNSSQIPDPRKSFCDFWDTMGYQF